jgi:hypothetical protein
LLGVLPAILVRIWVFIRYKIQFNAMLKESFEACKRPGEPLSRRRCIHPTQLNAFVGSMAFTSTNVDAPYISQSHLIS